MPIAVQSTCTRSAGRKAGHKLPSEVLFSSRPAALASSPEMPSDGEHEMVCTDGKRDADGQDERMAPPLHREIQANPERRARTPPPERRRFHKRRNRPPVRIRPHQGHGGQAHGSSDSGHETARDRVGDEAHQVGEPVSPHQEKAHAGGDCADHERSRRGDEQRIPVGLHGGADLRHHDHQRGRQPRIAPRKPPARGDDQAGGEVSEQDQADALGGIRSQQPGEYEAPEGDLGDQQPEARGESRPTSAGTAFADRMSARSSEARLRRAEGIAVTVSCESISRFQFKQRSGPCVGIVSFRTIVSPTFVSREQFAPHISPMG